MFNISPYSLHPLVGRFVVLWRYAKVASDCLTFVFSFLCCQCCEPSPWSHSTPSSPDVSYKQKICLEDAVDIGKACGEPMQVKHLVIDFNPGREDTQEVQEKVCKFWDTIRKQNIQEDIKIKDEKTYQVNDIRKNTNIDYPTIHLVNKL